MTALSLVFDLIGRDVSASKAFKDVGDSAEKASKKANDSTRMLSTGFKVAGAALAGAGLIEGFKFLYEQAAESAKIGRLTTQVIASTGGAAKITAKQVGDLATAISNKTGVDDEAIQSGANLLLTFTNVRNEVGKGNDIFNQATQTITDMSAALGQDTSSSAIQLGKALNDPIKGVTALQRVGVSFTESQKKQIKTLVDSGKTMDAQKLILKELGREFGGAAAAASTPLDKLKVNLGNLAEAIGTWLFPLVDKVATFFTGTLLPAIQSFAGYIQNKFGPIFDAVGTAISDFFSGFTVGTDELGSAQSKFAVFGAVAYEIFDKVRATATRTFNWLRDNAFPVLQKIGAFLASTFTPLWQALVDLWNRHVYPAVQTVAASFKDLWPIIKVVGGILLEVAAIFIKNVLPILFKVAGVIIDVLAQAFRDFAKVANWLWSNVLKPVFSALGTAWEATAKGFGWAYTNLIRPTFNALSRAVGAVKDSFNTAVGTIGKIWDGLVGVLKKPVQVVIDVVWNNGLRRLWNTINNIWGGTDIAPFKFADGGMMPGYSPGRDVHKFYSPTAGMLELSGGEPVLRPEAGAVLGRGWVDGINSAARSGGTAGVSRFLGAYADGGYIGLGDRSLPWWVSLMGPQASLINGYLAGEKRVTGDQDGSPWGKTLGSMARGIGNNLWGVVKSKLSAVFGAIAGTLHAGTPAAMAPSSQAGNVAAVRSWASPYGWDTGAQWDALVSVVNRESGFRNTAQNPSSSAYGMFQFLNSTWGAMGGAKTSDPVRQAQLGLKYISQVYGDPLGALRHEQAFGWYDRGGWLKPGLTLAYNGTGKPERIRTAEQEAALGSGRIVISLDGQATTDLLSGLVVEYDVAGRNAARYS